MKEVSGMEEAVREAFSCALPGDTVLLSPACTSWDSYANYGARGDHFVTLVREEIERREGNPQDPSSATFSSPLTGTHA